MPRPAKKKTRVLAQAAEEGRLKAQTQDEYKSVKFLADVIPFLPEKYKKNAVIWIKHMVEKNADKIPKTIAIIGLTVIIKQIIKTTESLQTRIKQLFKGEVAWTVTEPFGFLWGQITGQIPITETYGYFKEQKEGFFPEWMDWLIAFSLAYIIVEHGGQIALGLGSVASSLSGMVGFLLG